MATTSNQHFLVRNTNMRNELLKQTDYYMLSDVYETLTDDEKQQIKDYRQALRNHINLNRDRFLVEGINFIDFPIPPSFVKVSIPKY